MEQKLVREIGTYLYHLRFGNFRRILKAEKERRILKEKRNGIINYDFIYFYFFTDDKAVKSV